jgi:hypothetical protein
MTHVIFAGPTLSVAEISARHPDAVVYPPVRQGDIVSVLREHQPEAIGIIDGFFLSVLSVWHKEILSALDQGVRVYGAASMGALRAAECAPFGMIGVGRIFAMYLSGELTRDDEVAVAHASEEFAYRELSEPLINIRLNLGAAAAAGVIPTAVSAALVDQAADLYFPDRHWRHVIESPLLTPDESAALAHYVRTQAIDHKAQDARLMVHEMAARQHQRPTAEPPDTWTLQRTHYLEAVEQCDRWDVRQGESITPETVSRYALANDPRAPQLERTAMLELVATFAAGRLGIAPTAADIAATRAKFEADRGIRTEAQLQNYCRRNNLTEAELEDLMEHHTTVAQVLDWLLLSRFKLGTVQPLLDQYRLRDEYELWADAAVFAQQVCGAGDDGASATIPLPDEPIPDQVRRHQSATGWSSRGLSLAEWSKRHGFIHQDALLMEFERSRRARSVLAVAGQAAAVVDSREGAAEPIDRATS